MVDVQVGEQEEHAFGALAHEPDAELPDAGAGVEDHDVAAGRPELDARRVPPYRSVSWPGEAIDPRLPQIFPFTGDPLRWAT